MLQLILDFSGILQRTVRSRRKDQDTLGGEHHLGGRGALPGLGRGEGQGHRLVPSLAPYLQSDLEQATSPLCGKRGIGE